MQATGDSHSMIWQLMGLTLLLVAGEMMNKDLIFVPHNLQTRFTSPVWIRRYLWVCNVLMYLLFVVTILIPWRYPYISRYTSSNSHWDDDGADVSYRKHDGNEYELEAYSFGKYYGMLGCLRPPSVSCGELALQASNVSVLAL